MQGSSPKIATVVCVALSVSLQVSFSLYAQKASQSSAGNQTHQSPSSSFGRPPRVYRGLFLDRRADIAGQPATSHRFLFYENDFSYLNDPCYDGSELGDCLKLLPVGPSGGIGTIDFGGQFRLRWHNEIGMGQEVGTTRFEDTSNDFLLSRLRLYSNWRASDQLRFFIEGLLADVGGEGDYVPRPIDRNYGDFQNIFVQLSLCPGLSLRVGRQELLFGNQRVIAPLDWANTRRTFEGVTITAKREKWRIDGFITRPVIVDPTALDRADMRQGVYGYYGVYRGIEDAKIEHYYIGYDNRNPDPITGDFSLHTLGFRLIGNRNSWFYELEGGPQFGRQSGLGSSHSAGFCTVGIGRSLEQVLPGSPIAWFYLDYASGDVPGENFNRFNQLFPLAHKYLGFIDAVARSNVVAPNFLLTIRPHRKLSLKLWYHYFAADSAADLVPSNGGTPPQDSSSTDFGHELDLLARLDLNARSNVLLGWSHLWPGEKIVTASRTDADFFYAQWEVNF